MDTPMATSEKVFEVMRKQTRQKLARSLHECSDLWRIEVLSDVQRDAFLEQADFLLARFNIHEK